ncbi:hypothetical protein GGH12_002564 [Coemansia sp. RSA 1822]|nr:hypothetical protein IW147_003033 [Coemansia sp. RSA 720]KAJ2480748.1 hypothetical protein IWW56_002261 [Coemansia sp. RSA 2131]KAJ2545292.1 hypothetical protein GGF49_000526 [Coemansia sp. RSA 1853]KAJ2563481.1 hypothetical protein GGH12_002564 [Coemansia sp. RSA 1822]
MAFKNTAMLALAALATTSYAAPANADDFPTDTAAIMSMMTDPAFKASMSDALNSLSDYLSKNPGVLSSLTAIDALSPLETAASGGDDNDSDTSGAASIKSAAIAAAGLSLFAALF